MNLTIRRDKWLRGSASHLMTGDGCGCVIGHYLLAKGVPKEIILNHYGFVAGLEPFAGNFPELGEFVDDEGEPYFRTTLDCDYLIGVNDGDPRSIHDRYVHPVNNDRQREAVLLRLMAKMNCRLRFIDPLRRVVKSDLMWEGNPHQAGQRSGNRTFLREKMDCGHTTESRPRKAKRRRCDECSRGHKA